MKMISEVAEEALEKIWVFQEDHPEDPVSPEIESFDPEVIKELDDLKFIQKEEGEFKLTSEGLEEAKNVIRRHRLAEKLLHDILGLSGEDMETAACNFEHIMEGRVEESICTLLSHPQKCPHGKPIPKYGCECTSEVKTVIDGVKTVIDKTVLPLNKMDKGEKGEIVYIKSSKRDNLQKILAMGVLPGRKIEIIQTYPSHVFQMEHTQMAVDSDIAGSIYVGSTN
ncbi:MAG: metal-dependent transcriptional regulator [Euryarchaeota archaeon]|nr:metal-dependent transcriptional regulator [Euryarchaeota archaeon]MBV1729163.1 metal-dependent transcriptional regulator [Methanobacterium sp.]MBU4547312.1 metal-dependent transcriptional regulator [Euryarchaeota archaeon]MBU4607502.1 metal-dependent transcriptional regulator [Euryarchaeota archaeon]MBV1754723.1 metal-dependent transcriptional regulator [Methanobacterium sp.]